MAQMCNTIQRVFLNLERFNTLPPVGSRHWFADRIRRSKLSVVATKPRTLIKFFNVKLVEHKIIN